MSRQNSALLYDPMSLIPDPKKPNADEKSKTSWFSSKPKADIPKKPDYKLDFLKYYKITEFKNNLKTADSLDWKSRSKKYSEMHSYLKAAQAELELRMEQQEALESSDKNWRVVAVIQLLIAARSAKGLAKKAIIQTLKDKFFEKVGLPEPIIAILDGATDTISFIKQIKEWKKNPEKLILPALETGLDVAVFLKATKDTVNKYLKPPIPKKVGEALLKHLKEHENTLEEKRQKTEKEIFKALKELSDKGYIDETDPVKRKELIDSVKEKMRALDTSYGILRRTDYEAANKLRENMLNLAIFRGDSHHFVTASEKTLTHELELDKKGTVLTDEQVEKYYQNQLKKDEENDFMRAAMAEPEITLALNTMKIYESLFSTSRGFDLNVIIKLQQQLYQGIKKLEELHKEPKFKDSQDYTKILGLFQTERLRFSTELKDFANIYAEHIADKIKTTQFALSTKTEALLREIKLLEQFKVVNPILQVEKNLNELIDNKINKLNDMLKHSELPVKSLHEGTVKFATNSELTSMAQEIPEDLIIREMINRLFEKKVEGNEKAAFKTRVETYLSKHSDYALKEQLLLITEMEQPIHKRDKVRAFIQEKTAKETQKIAKVGIILDWFALHEKYTTQVRKEKAASNKAFEAAVDQIPIQQLDTQGQDVGSPTQTSNPPQLSKRLDTQTESEELKKINQEIKELEKVNPDLFKASEKQKLWAEVIEVFMPDNALVTKTYPVLDLRRMKMIVEARRSENQQTKNLEEKALRSRILDGLLGTSNSDTIDSSFYLADFTPTMLRDLVDNRPAFRSQQQEKIFLQDIADSMYQRLALHQQNKIPDLLAHQNNSLSPSNLYSLTDMDIKHFGVFIRSNGTNEVKEKLAHLEASKRLEAQQMSETLAIRTKLEELIKKAKDELDKDQRSIRGEIFSNQLQLRELQLEPEKNATAIVAGQQKLSTLITQLDAQSQVIIQTLALLDGIRENLTSNNLLSPDKRNEFITNLQKIAQQLTGIRSQLTKNSPTNTFPAFLALIDNIESMKIEHPQKEKLIEDYQTKPYTDYLTARTLENTSRLTEDTGNKLAWELFIADKNPGAGYYQNETEIRKAYLTDQALLRTATHYLKDQKVAIRTKETELKKLTEEVATAKKNSGRLLSALPKRFQSAIEKRYKVDEKEQLIASKTTELERDRERLKENTQNWTENWVKICNELIEKNASASLVKEIRNFIHQNANTLTSSQTEKSELFDKVDLVKAFTDKIAAGKPFSELLVARDRIFKYQEVTPSRRAAINRLMAYLTNEKNIYPSGDGDTALTSDLQTLSPSTSGVLSAIKEHYQKFDQQRQAFLIYSLFELPCDKEKAIKMFEKIPPTDEFYGIFLDKLASDLKEFGRILPSSEALYLHLISTLRGALKDRFHEVIEKFLSQLKEETENDPEGVKKWSPATAQLIEKHGNETSKHAYRLVRLGEIYSNSIDTVSFAIEDKNFKHFLSTISSDPKTAITSLLQDTDVQEIVKQSIGNQSQSLWSSGEESQSLWWDEMVVRHLGTKEQLQTMHLSWFLSEFDMNSDYYKNKDLIVEELFERSKSHWGKTATKVMMLQDIVGDSEQVKKQLDEFLAKTFSAEKIDQAIEILEGKLVKNLCEVYPEMADRVKIRIQQLNASKAVVEELETRVESHITKDDFSTFAQTHADIIAIPTFKFEIHADVYFSSFMLPALQKCEKIIEGKIQRGQLLDKDQFMQVVGTLQNDISGVTSVINEDLATKMATLLGADTTFKTHLTNLIKDVVDPTDLNYCESWLEQNPSTNAIARSALRGFIDACKKRSEIFQTIFRAQKLVEIEHGITQTLEGKTETDPKRLELLTHHADFIKKFGVRIHEQYRDKLLSSVQSDINNAQFDRTKIKLISRILTLFNDEAGLTRLDDIQNHPLKKLKAMTPETLNSSNISVIKHASKLALSEGATTEFRDAVKNENVQMIHRLIEGNRANQAIRLLADADVLSLLDGAQIAQIKLKLSNPEVSQVRTAEINLWLYDAVYRKSQTDLNTTALNTTEFAKQQLKRLVEELQKNDPIAFNHFIERCKLVAQSTEGPSNENLTYLDFVIQTTTTNTLSPSSLNRYRLIPPPSPTESHGLSDTLSSTASSNEDGDKPDDDELLVPVIRRTVTFHEPAPADPKKADAYMQSNTNSGQDLKPKTPLTPVVQSPPPKKPISEIVKTGLSRKKW